jgi:hypothetical protein
MAKQEVTRTPDKLQGAENASRAIANVLNFTLGREIQQEKQRQAMEAVAQEQQFRQMLQDREDEAAFARLQSDLASRNVINERLEERKQAELEELQKYRMAMLGKEEEQTRIMRQLKAAKEKEYKEKGEIAWLLKSYDDRQNMLDSLLDTFSETRDIELKPRINTILREMQVFQNQIDRFRQTDTLPSPTEINERIEATRYGSLIGLPPTTQELNAVAKGEKKEAVPKDRKAEATKFLQENGLPVTDANINYYLENMQ